MPIRNPFTRRPGPVVSDENVHPDAEDPSHPGFERVDTVGSKASSALSIRSVKSQDTGEYKMSVVNDSGVYLPPSPTEDRSVWPRKYLSSRTSTDTSSIGDIEHFSISRESFDSYRRSFDISARSQIVGHEVPARQSLDSARFPRIPRSAVERKLSSDLPPADEGFEDVGLDDATNKPQPPHTTHRRGFFSKFTTTSGGQEGNPTSNPGTARFSMTGRRRGQSGQGAELGTIERPKTAASVEVQEVQS